jgi:hypothetical protein
MTVTPISSPPRGLRSTVVKVAATVFLAMFCIPGIAGTVVLARQPDVPRALLLLPLLFVLLPILGIVAMWSSKPKPLLSPAGSMPTATPAVLEPVLLPVGGGSRPRNAPAAAAALRPALGPLGKLVGVTIAALFWNGIVSVFVVVIGKEWAEGSWPIFPTLFLTPFVAVGIGLLVGAGYCLLACFNPRAVVELIPTGVTVGGSTLVRWSFTGRPSRITRLTITLEGREEATYQQGTSSRTDQEMFHTSRLVDSTGTWEIPRGEVRLVIPEHTMHTFMADHNKIVWVLKLHGDIPRWPDVDEELPVTVLPAPPRGQAT